jgi:hypothetical protein
MIEIAWQKLEDEGDAPSEGSINDLSQKIQDYKSKRLAPVQPEAERLLVLPWPTQPCAPGSKT